MKSAWLKALPHFPQPLREALVDCLQELAELGVVKRLRVWVEGADLAPSLRTSRERRPHPRAIMVAGVRYLISPPPIFPERVQRAGGRERGAGAIRGAEQTEASSVAARESEED